MLYVGVTRNLERRINEHREDSHGSKKTFCGRYNCHFLIYYEEFLYPIQAIEREKELKKWSRKKKETLINSENPSWDFIDLN